MSKHHHKFHVDFEAGHSHLRSHDNADKPIKQPCGHPTGEHSDVGAHEEHHVFKHHDHDNPAKARHHPPVSEKADKFERPHTRDADGYGHDATQRHGCLRMSGVEGAHRIGKRKK